MTSSAANFMLMYAFLAYVVSRLVVIPKIKAQGKSETLLVIIALATILVLTFFTEFILIGQKNSLPISVYEWYLSVLIAGAMLCLYGWLVFQFGKVRKLMFESSTLIQILIGTPLAALAGAVAGASLKLSKYLFKVFIE